MENPNINSVDPESNPGTPAAESPRNPDFVPQVPPSIENKQETTHCKPDQTPLWKIVLETFAVIVGIVVAWIYYGQLEVMRGQLGEIIKQYPEIQKSADAAKIAAQATKDSVTLTRESSHLEQRAWLVPVFPVGQNMPINPAGLASARAVLI